MKNIEEILQYSFLGLPVLNYIKFAVILFLAILLRKYISKILASSIFKLIGKVIPEQFSQKFKDLVHRPIENIILYIAFFISVLQIAELLEDIVLIKRKSLSSSIVGEEARKLITASTFTLMDLIERIFFLIIIFTVTNLVNSIFKFIFYVLTERARQNKNRERQQIFPLLRDVITVILYAIAFLIILGVVFKVNVVTLIAGLGMGSIAIAFALKDSLENLLSSFMILVDKPFTIGDWIRVDGVEGTVERVGFRSTRIRSFDRTQISVPNKNLVGSKVENLSERGLRRVKMSIGAAYGLSSEQLQKMAATVNAAIKATKGVRGDTSVIFDTFGDSTLNLAVTYYVDTKSEIPYDKIRESINYKIYDIVNEMGGGFPYPTQSLIISHEEIPTKAGTEPQIDNNTNKEA